jgi:hypothetical protein
MASLQCSLGSGGWEWWRNLWKLQHLFGGQNRARLLRAGAAHQARSSNWVGDEDVRSGEILRLTVALRLPGIGMHREKTVVESSFILPLNSCGACFCPVDA